jgi:hypothetical protein
VLEHIIEGDSRNVVHVNMHLVEAASPEQAYEKALTLGRDSQAEYANPPLKARPRDFPRLGNLTVIHDALEAWLRESWLNTLRYASARLVVSTTGVAMYRNHNSSSLVRP